MKLDPNMLGISIMICAVFGTLGVVLVSSVTPINAGWFLGDTSIQDLKQRYNVTDFCSGYAPYYDQSADCQNLANTNEIIKQNKILIEQNEQVLKNQDILKCYELRKSSYTYAYKFGFGLDDSEITADSAEALRKICGE